MSAISARFFAWIQGAPFYEDVHRAAVELLPPGEGKSWLDVGCGPGLVARLAAERGYDAIGLDRDPAMVSAARRTTPRCGFEIGDAYDLGARRADVVSAASLLILIPERDRALASMWNAVRPGGVFVAIETTAAMTPEAAREVRVRSGRRTGLALWARARNGRAIDAAIFERVPGAIYERHPLLDGLVAAHLLRKVSSDG
jgi:trans-aconitate methyltransferase